MKLFPPSCATTVIKCNPLSTSSCAAPRALTENEDAFSPNRQSPAWYSFLIRAALACPSCSVSRVMKLHCTVGLSSRAATYCLTCCKNALCCISVCRILKVICRVPQLMYNGFPLRSSCSCDYVTTWAFNTVWLICPRESHSLCIVSDSDMNLKKAQRNKTT